jgi:hypothetical protein
MLPTPIAALIMGLVSLDLALVASASVPPPSVAAEGALHQGRQQGQHHGADEPEPAGDEPGAPQRNVLRSTGSLMRDLYEDTRLWRTGLITSWFWLVPAKPITRRPKACAPPWVTASPPAMVPVRMARKVAAGAHPRGRPQRAALDRLPDARPLRGYAAVAHRAHPQAGKAHHQEAEGVRPAMGDREPARDGAGEDGEEGSRSTATCCARPAP